VERPDRAAAEDREPGRADAPVEVRDPGEEEQTARERRAPGRVAAATGVFAFVQFEFGFLLGPDDGRYLRRASPDAEPERVIVLRTLGARQRRHLRGRRGRPIGDGEPEPVPTSRATLVRPEPFDSEQEASAWLEDLRRDPEGSESEVADAARELNALLRVHRAAAVDPYARDVDVGHALVVRVGYGGGDEVADGRFAAAFELSRRTARARRAERLAPQERFAAVLGGRDRILACEELVLRARADLDAGRQREAALQARIALECALAELGGEELSVDRGAVGKAANAALRGELSGELTTAVADAVEHMETALRRHARAAVREPDR
jgi:hypothetical protein